MFSGVGYTKALLTWSSPGDSWLCMGGLNDIQRSLPSHPFCGSTIIYLTVIPVLLFYGKIKEFCLLMTDLLLRHIYSDKNSSCATNLLVSSSHRNCAMRDC